MEETEGGREPAEGKGLWKQTSSVFATSWGHAVNLPGVFPSCSGRNNGTHILEGMKWVGKRLTSEHHTKGHFP